MQFMGEMKDPGVFLGWKVQRGESISVSIEFWYRGLPVKKSGQTYKVLLLDCGKLIQVNVEDMKPLPEKFMKVLPFAYQVAPKTGGKFSKDDSLTFKKLLTSILKSEDLKMFVVFLGQLEGGRWLVKLKTDDDVDLSEGKNILGRKRINKWE